MILYRFAAPAQEEPSDTTDAPRILMAHFSSSDTDLHPLAPGANWFNSRRFAAGTSQDAVSGWIGGLDLPKREEGAGAEPHLILTPGPSPSTAAM